MQVSWDITKNESPIIYQKRTQWAGLKLAHARIAPGEMQETTPATHEITITLAGTLTALQQSKNGKRQIQKRRPGSFCLNAAGQSFSARWKNEFEYLMINIEPIFLAQIARENNFSRVPEILETIPNCDGDEGDPLIKHIGMTLLSYNTTDDDFSGRLYTDSLAQTLMLHLLKNYTSASVAAPADFRGGLPAYKVRRVEEFVRENLDRDLSLAELAEAANLSQFHFARAFRRTTGITPHEFLMQKRIELAKDLLANSNLPIVEISNRSGFKNQSHFTNLFRKLNRLTPKHWREIKHS
jgi:AraC family transcriptional regulator